MFRHRVFIKRRKRNGTKYLLKCTRTCNTTTPPSTWKTTRTTTMLIRLQPVRRKQSVTQPLYPGHTKTTTTTPTTVHTIERWWSDHRPSILGAADCFYLLLKNTTQPAPLFLKTDRRLVFFPLPYWPYLYVLRFRPHLYVFGPQKRTSRRRFSKLKNGEIVQF